MPRGTKTGAAPNQGEGLTPVKNGWLVIGLLCSVLVMLGLMAGDFYLLRHPAVSSKLFGKPDAREPLSPTGADSCTAKETAKETRQTAPEMTFYTRLSGVYDSSPRLSEGEDLVGDATPQSTANVENPKASSKQNGAPVSQASRLDPASGGLLHAGERSLPEPQKGSPIYTVQVGAFTQPGIAQEWAAKWKAKGYDVALKPVARPKTGIIYRLYLGSFSSEKSAEELVRHLKAKEGISAFTLVLRN